MNRRFNFLYPALMLVGLLISALVVITALQAANAPTSAPAQSQVAVSENSNDRIAQGRALFVAKGCLVCHRYDEMAAVRRAMGDFDFDDVPNLSNLKIDAEYAKRWLRDPKAIKPLTAMPNLNLTEHEIDALVAFLTAPKQ